MALNMAKIMALPVAALAIGVPEPISSVVGSIVVSAIVYDAVTSGKKKPRKRRESGRNNRGLSSVSPARRVAFLTGAIMAVRSKRNKRFNIIDIVKGALDDSLKAKAVTCWRTKAIEGLEKSIDELREAITKLETDMTKEEWADYSASGRFDDLGGA